MSLITLWIHLTIALFAVLNPVGNVPVFLALTADRDGNAQRRIARRAVVVAFAIVMVFALFGQMILGIFGITLNAFRVAGGIILFTIALRLLEANPSHMHHPREEEGEEDDVAVTPLGTPLLAGPGTIATVMALGAHGGLLTGDLLVFGSVGTVLLLTYFIFRSAPSIGQRLGPTGINIVTRLMGLLLAVVAVQMAADGLSLLFPNLRL